MTPSNRPPARIAPRRPPRAQPPAPPLDRVRQGRLAPPAAPHPRSEVARPASYASVAGAHGSRTHRATPNAAPPVLKTGGSTGTPPLPCHPRTRSAEAELRAQEPGSCGARLRAAHRVICRIPLEHGPVHRPEVVSDEAERRTLRQSIGQPVERGGQPELFELEVGDVGLGIDRVRHPRQPPGGQDRSDPELGVGACLRQELGPIAAVLAEPVQEQDPGPNPAVGRLDDVRLHPGIVAAQELIGDAPRHGGHCATGTYDQRVLDFAVPTIRLTELTTCGGCAAKLGADALAEALSGLGIDDGLDGAGSADLIAGLDPPDDAAVHLVAPDLAVIGTLDFFPPIVDDPRTFG